MENFTSLKRVTDTRDTYFYFNLRNYEWKLQVRFTLQILNFLVFGCQIFMVMLEMERFNV